MNLTKQEKWEASQFEAYSKYIHTWESRKFLNIIEAIVGLFFGNQRGKGAMASMGYMHRVMGSHPVPERNVNYAECYNGHKFSPIMAKKIKDGLCPKCAKPNRKAIKMHERGSKVICFAGDILPESAQPQTRNKYKGEDGAKEVRCVQYMEFMKWIPPFLIKSLPSTRRPTIELKDIYGGDDITIKFTTYKMGVSGIRGQQFISFWGDELGSEEYYEEVHPRLVIENGDILITYTVTEEEKSTALYDMIFDRARVFYRTKHIVEEYYKKVLDKNVEQIERNDSPYSIAVVQSSTNDNPIMTNEQVETYLMNFADPDVRIMRQFCAWRQLSAKIYPQFDWGVHAIDGEKLFKEQEMALVND
jgi:hypothetical protein